jgi:hypothetical protein
MLDEKKITELAAKRILNELDGIKYGEIADPHHWIIKI